MTSPTLEAFLAALPPSQRAAVRQAPQPLEQALARAQQAWPEVALAPEEFAARLGQLLAGEEGGLALLDKLHLEDLYLASACAVKDPRALALCEARFLPEAVQALQRMGLQPTQVDEVLQTVRERLFVGGVAGQPGHIASYAAKGRLGGWIRVVATRQALMALRKDKGLTPAPEEDLERLVESGKLLEGSGLEDQHMKLLYQAEFKEAFRQAVGELTAQEQQVLQQYFLEGMTIDQLGEAHGVHRATAARWVERAKRSLMTGVRRAVMQKLNLQQETYESVVKLISSQMDLSLRILWRR